MRFRYLMMTGCTSSGMGRHIELKVLHSKAEGFSKELRSYWLGAGKPTRRAKSMNCGSECRFWNSCLTFIKISPPSRY